MAQALPPGLRGYTTMETHNAGIARERLSGLSTLQQMQERQYKMGLEEQYRQEIAGTRSPEEQVAIASKYMGPDALARTQQAHQDRQASLANTKEIALTRLQQAKSQFDQNIQIRMRQATTAEEKNRIMQEYHQGNLVLRQHAAQLGAADRLYNIGVDIPAPTLPGAAPGAMPGQPAAGAPAPPPQAGMASSGLETVLAGRPPAEQQAILAAASGRPTNLTATPEGGLIPEQGDAAFQGPAVPPAVAQALVPPPAAAGAVPPPAAAVSGATGAGAAPQLEDFPPVGPPVTQLYRDEGSRTYVPTGPVRPAPAAPGTVPVAVGVPPAAPAAVPAVAGGSPGEPARPLAPVVAAQPAVPPLPQSPSKPPEYASWPKAKRDKFDADMALAQGKPSIAGAAALGETEARNLAIQALYDPSVLVGYRRDGKAMGMIARAQTTVMQEFGISNEDLVTGRAGFKADTGSLNKLVPQYDAITAFENTAKRNGQVLIKLGEKVDASGIPVIERWIRAGRQATGDPDVAEFNAQMHVYRPEVARILTQPTLTGILSDSARQEAAEFIQGGASAAQIKRVVGRLESDFDARKQTLEEQIGNIRDRMRNRIGPGAAAQGGMGVGGKPAPAKSGVSVSNW